MSRKAKKRGSGRKRPAGYDRTFGLEVHGAYKRREDAEAKRKRLGRSAFVVKKFARYGGRGHAAGSRFVVFKADKASEFKF